jgi:predicted dehydrogenase
MIIFQRVGLGILGAANIARKNIRAIKMVDSLEVVAIGSRDITKAQAMITEWELADTAAYGSYEEVLKDPRVDAVYIPLPSTLHVEWVTKAAEAGKHILLEKPIVSAEHEIAAILKVCNANDVQCMDGTMWPHNLRTPRMKSILKSGELGHTKEVISTFSFAAPEAFIKNDIRFQSSGDPLGCLGDLGWYCIGAILFAFNYEPPYAVVAHHGAIFNEEGVPTSISASLLFDDGGRGIFTCSFDCALTQRLQITGTKGSLVLDDFVIPKDDEISEFTVSRNHSLGKYDLADVTEREVIAVRNAMPQEASMWGTFARCVQNAKYRQEIAAGWLAGSIQTQKIVCAVLESAKKGCVPVSLSVYTT